MTRLPDLDEATRAEVLHSLRRVADKLLHEPTVRVKELANETAAVSYAAALAELFALDPDAVEAVTRPEGLHMSAIRVGTRASLLATTQSRLVADLVAAHLGREVVLVEVSTEGDRSAAPARAARRHRRLRHRAARGPARRPRRRGGALAEGPAHRDPPPGSRWPPCLSARTPVTWSSPATG